MSHWRAAPLLLRLRQRQLGERAGVGWHRLVLLTWSPATLSMNLKIPPLQINNLRILRLQGFHARVFRGNLSPLCAAREKVLRLLKSRSSRGRTWRENP